MPISKAIEESRLKFARQRCPTPILEPIDCIKRALKYFENSFAVSCSFGSCSVAVLHMTLKLNPHIPVMFQNTTVQYPETYEYRDRLVNEWGINLIETKPVKPFWDVIKEYGLPTIRRKYYYSYQKLKGLKRKRHTFQEKTGKPACCWFCKDKPFLNACKNFGIIATLTGLRVAESKTRMYFGADYGQFHFTKRHKIMKYHPILFWSREQLDRYFEKHNIPKSEVYTKLGLERNGCMPCTGQDS